jgi:hypothetical protein
MKKHFIFINVIDGGKTMAVFTDEEKKIVDLILGAWNLVEWSERKNNGENDYPLGADAIGRIIYTETGHMSAQLVRKRREKFVSEDWRSASSVEAARAWKECFGYFGTFLIDLAKHAVIHHVEGGWFPNLHGSEQVRVFQIEGTRLSLDADTQWGKVRIIWERTTLAIR